MKWSGIYTMITMANVYKVVLQAFHILTGFPGGSSGKEAACQCRRRRDTGSVPELERSPEGGHGNPLQYSCLENPMD